MIQKGKKMLDLAAAIEQVISNTFICEQIQTFYLYK